jgi:ATP-dependent DNA helicase RecG
MKVSDLKKDISLGEDSTRQFKVDVRKAESLASEMAAFANSDGGSILLGVPIRNIAPGF